ncbi:MAG TPA: tetratricopeptide repeat protein [Longimicrobiales bacterium]
MRRSLTAARPWTAGVVLLWLGVAGPAAGQQPAVHDHARAARGGIPLYDDLGTHHRRITTRSPEAQAYFDQGLRLESAFNHPEAIQSYQEALRRDPDCAMCWWGIALAAGPNINGPMSPEAGRQAYAAIREAQARASSATAVERALIAALAKRYAADPEADRAPLDSAYARAMAEVARNYPDDVDVLTLYAAALMNLSPWNYWEGEYRDRKPRPGTADILSTLERALAIAPDHPGACHYYIHAVEAAFPDKAVPCADRLASLMPGAGHVVHMPGHIYIRVGRYVDAVRTNEHAVHSDEKFIADRGVSTLYTGAYYPHNYHFMAFAATMAGMSEKAIEAARIVSPRVPVEVARDVYWIQNAVVLPHITLLTFGRWQDVLAEPMPPAELGQATIMATYARGVALAALGRFDEARGVLEEIRKATAEAGDDPTTDPVPHIAPLALAGEIALRSGDAEDAVKHFRAAVEIEDALLYEEPPLWYYPIRHSLGRALLEAGRPAEAEQAYRQDLDRFPHNGWSLFGLMKSLEAQGRNSEAAQIRARFREAWKHADVELTASRF